LSQTIFIIEDDLKIARVVKAYIEGGRPGASFPTLSSWT
jgi:hypothetical protein